MKQLFLIMVLMASFATTTISCKEKSTGEKVEDAIDEAGDAVEDAVDDTGDAIDKTVKDVKDEVEDATDS